MRITIHLCEWKILLVQEKSPKVYGLWNLPAGHVDPGETPVEAAVRETREETGLIVETIRDLGPQPDGDRFRHAFTARITGGKLQPDPNEVLGARWHTLDEIKALNAEGKLRAPWVYVAITKAAQA